MGYVSFDISCNLIPICCGKFVIKDFEIISYQLRAIFFYYALLCSHFNADWLKAHSLLIILDSAMIHIKFCKQNTAMLLVRREN